jgi:hypothetical protein
MRDCRVDSTINIKRSFLFLSGNGTDLNNLCPGSNTRIKIRDDIPLKSDTRLALGLLLGLGLISLLLLGVAVVYYNKNKLMEKEMKHLKTEYAVEMVHVAAPTAPKADTMSMPTSKI